MLVITEVDLEDDGGTLSHNNQTAGARGGGALLSTIVGWLLYHYSPHLHPPHKRLQVFTRLIVFATLVKTKYLICEQVITWQSDDGRDRKKEQQQFLLPFLYYAETDDI